MSKKKYIILSESRNRQKVSKIFSEAENVLSLPCSTGLRGAEKQSEPKIGGSARTEREGAVEFAQPASLFDVKKQNLGPAEVWRKSGAKKLPKAIKAAKSWQKWAKKAKGGQQQREVVKRNSMRPKGPPPLPPGGSGFGVQGCSVIEHPEHRPENGHFKKRKLASLAAPGPKPDHSGGGGMPTRYPWGLKKNQNALPLAYSIPPDETPVVTSHFGALVHLGWPQSAIVSY